MLKNYIKIAFRNIWKTKLHSFITVTGLATGIACCLLIILFVKDEWTFDKFHDKADRIYRAWVFEDYGKDEQFFNTRTPYPLGPALKDNFSEVATFVRHNQIGQSIKAGVDTYNETVSVVGKDFFEVFDFNTLHGKLKNVLNEKSNAVITRSAAQKYFGVDNAVGETLEMDFGDGVRVFTIKAIVENPPTNSSLQFSVIISDLNNEVLVSKRALESWFNVNAETYVVLQKNVDPNELESKFPAMVKQIMGENYVEEQYNIGLQPLTDIHLNKDMPVGIAAVSDPQYAIILSAIALLILLLGAINFVSLSVSRSVNRSKEVGVRKVVGAKRQELIIQFLSEAVITTFIAIVAGVILAYLLLPLFNQLANRYLVLTFDPFMLLSVTGLLLIIGIVAGSYPALLLSGFQPATILKGGNTPVGKKQRLRKGLVGLQFMLTVFLISTTLLMKKQLDYIQSKNLGFDKEHLLVVQLNVKGGQGLIDRINKGFEKAQLFKNELKGVSSIQQSAAGNHTFGTGGWTNVGYTDKSDKYRTFDLLAIDENYIPAMKMEMVAGRNFSLENTSDTRRSVIVNEALVKEYGWDNPIGKQLPGENFGDHEIVGIVNDFNYNSLHGTVAPLVMVMDPTAIDNGIENIGIGSNPIPKLLVRVDGSQTANAIKAIEGVWAKITTGEEEFAYTFVDQTLAAQYRQEHNLGKIVSIAAFLAIIIGCMGLFALASLNMQSRTKEISIRKVLGASEQTILRLLSKEYIVLVLVALVVSIPVTLYVVNKWLSDFAYRIEIGAGTFITTGLIAVVITLVTITYHAVKTAMKRPVETLKYE